MGRQGVNAGHKVGREVGQGVALLLGFVAGLLLFLVELLPFVGDFLADGMRALAWWARDVAVRAIRRQGERLYGLWVVVGLYGAGKTAFVVHELEEIRRQRGQKVRIYTNFGWAGEDGPIRGWRHMVEALESDTPHVFAWDELGSSLDQHAWGKEFPKDLFRFVTQMRKGPGVRVYCTVQRFSNASVDLRRLAKYIIEVRGLLGARWIWAWAYEGYEQYNDGLPRYSPMGQKDLRVTAWSKRFVFNDWLRSRYDSYRIIPALQEYSDEEMAQRARDDEQQRSNYQAVQARRASGATALAGPTARNGRTH